MEETKNSIVGDDELVVLSADRFTNASEARSQWEDDYILNWNMYENDYSADDARKAPWQAKGYVPYLTDMVDRMVGNILQAYEAQISRLYKSGSAQRALAVAMRALVMQELALNDFGNLLDEEVLEVIVSGYGVIRDEWDFYRGETKLSVVDPLDFYRLPDGMDGFLVCHPLVMERGALAVYAAGEEYNKAAVEAVMEMGRVPTLDAEDREAIEERKKKDEKASLNRYETLKNPATVYQFWGLLFNEDGDMIADGETIRWEICGNKVIRPPSITEYWDEGTPYSFGYAKRVKNAAYPKSIVRDHIVLQQGITRTLNKTIDKLRKHQTQWIAQKGQISREQIRRGINVGKIWVQKHPGHAGIQAITPSMTLDPEFSFIQLVERAMTAMGMTETDMGQTSTRNREPLGTARMRSAGSQAFLATVARRIERTLISNVIHRVIVNILQFKLHKPSNPNYEQNVVAFLGEDHKAGLELMRGENGPSRDMLKTDFADIRVRGLSDEVSKQEKAAGMNYFLRFYTQLLQTAAQVAQTAQRPEIVEEMIEAITMVNIPGVLYEAAALTGYDPEILLKPKALAAVNAADAGAAGPRKLEPGMEVVPPPEPEPALVPGAVGSGYPPAAEEKSIYDNT